MRLTRSLCGATATGVDVAAGPWEPAQLLSVETTVNAKNREQLINLA
jgi:hypothetical protein